MLSVSLLGSRNLSANYASLVKHAVAALHIAGVKEFCVPCGAGAASFARAALAERGLKFHLFAASAFPSASFRQSLAIRSRACVRASHALVVFMSSPDSVGSLAEIRLGITLRLPVYVFCCGFAAAELPALGGVWRTPPGPLGELGAVRWYPLAEQTTL